MRKSLLSLAAAGLIGGMSGTASAHIGETIYLVYEIADADVADIDIRDISVADWEDVVGGVPSMIRPTWTIASGWVGTVPRAPCTWPWNA